MKIMECELIDCAIMLEIKSGFEAYELGKTRHVAEAGSRPLERRINSVMSISAPT